VKQGSELPTDVAERLEAFIALLLAWTLRLNLIGRGTHEQIWTRHIADSLQLLPLIPPLAHDAIDVGSGAGLPGIVMAIAQPNLPMTLVESDQRKAAFLRHVAYSLALPNITVIAGRIEATNIQADVITARALAPLPKLLELVAPHLRTGGCALLLKGDGVEDELTAASLRWTFRTARVGSCTDPDGVILHLSEIARRDSPRGR